MHDSMTSYRLRFISLCHGGLDISVPCNEHGVVDLDQLGDEARQAYFFAHVLVGREFAKPVVCCSGDVSQLDFGQPGVASML